MLGYLEQSSLTAVLNWHLFFQQSFISCGLGTVLSFLCILYYQWGSRVYSFLCILYYQWDNGVCLCPKYSSDYSLYLATSVV
jgi:hypothetical protein